MKFEELEQRILAVYDAYDGEGEIKRGDICARVDCEGISCSSCPLSMGYLAKMMREGRGEAYDAREL